MNKLILLLSIVLISLPSINSKLVRGELTLSELRSSNWRYATKFGMDIGKGTYKIRMKIHQKESAESPVNSSQKYKLDVQVHLDEQWEEVRSRDSCEAKSRLAKKI